jgi:hypothetical protein
MRLIGLRIVTAAALGASLAACSSGGVTEAGPAVLLSEDFNEENGGSYRLNYTAFARWNVTAGSVDLVGTNPYDDFLPAGQGLYVDLDGTSRAAGTLESRETFELPRGTYELSFKLAGMPRLSQQPNTVIVSLGGVFMERITLESYVPLQPYTRAITVHRDTRGTLRFQHLGGDDHGILVDDIQLRRR